MLVFNQGWDRSLGTVFHILTKEEQVEFIVPRFKGVGLLDERDVRDARESLGNLKGLDMSEVEKEVYELLTKTVTLLSTSSLQGPSFPLHSPSLHETNSTPSLPLFPYPLPLLHVPLPACLQHLRCPLEHHRPNPPRPFHRFTCFDGSAPGL